MARRKLVLIAKRFSLVLRQAFEKEGRSLKRRAGAPKPHTALVDLGYRGVEVPGVEIIHRGRIKSLSAKARRLLKRRQAVEPVIGHLKEDCGLRRNWLKGSEGDVLHPVLCAAGYNLRWLMRAVTRLGLKALFARDAWAGRQRQHCSAAWRAAR